jgi:hypothetical protein
VNTRRWHDGHGVLRVHVLCIWAERDSITIRASTFCIAFLSYYTLYIILHYQLLHLFCCALRVSLFSFLFCPLVLVVLLRTSNANAPTGGGVKLLDIF